MCYICGGSCACVSSVRMGGGGGGQCVTSVVVPMPVGVYPVWEWVVVLVGSVLHLWWQLCLWECVLRGNGWWWTVCYICGASRVCVSSVGIGGDGQCVTSVVAAVSVCPLWK